LAGGGSEFSPQRRAQDLADDPTDVESELEQLYEGGRQIAAVGALPHEPDLARRLPRTCPYGCDLIWHRDVMAEAGVDLSGDGEAPKKRRCKRGA
jgi:hypothetical protein